MGRFNGILSAKKGDYCIFFYQVPRRAIIVLFYQVPRRAIIVLFYQVPKRAIIVPFYQVPNGANIQWIFKCQIGRFNGLLSAKWGDYYQEPNGAIYYYMPNGATKIIMPNGATSGSWSSCISCIICIT
jgi:hypothetical protein